MLIGTLSLAATISIFLVKLKEDINDENMLISSLDYLPSPFDQYCYFELNYMLKYTIYPHIFLTTLYITSIYDVAPEKRINDAIKYI